MSDSLIYAQNILLKWLGRREHSVFECQQYLKRKGIDIQTINKVIQSFIEKNYINDHRFTEIYIRHCKKRLYSRFMCKMKLLEKGIDKHIYDELSETLYTEEDEKIIAEKLTKKLLRQNKSIDKILTSLKRKAFKDSIIFKIKGDYYDNQ